MTDIRAELNLNARDELRLCWRGVAEAAPITPEFIAKLPSVSFTRGATTITAVVVRSSVAVVVIACVSHRWFGLLVE